MSRKGQAPKRRIIPDPKYKDPLVAKFVNHLMYDGKKSVAEQVFYNALDIAAQKESMDDPLKLFKQSLENVKPKLEVRSRRVGGATYQVPVEVRPERKVSLSIRWVIEYARARGDKTMEERLAAELSDAYQKRGGAMKKREETHKMAEANRAFAHYRW